MGQEPAISWARYQMAVTKYKEEEPRSSSMYTIWDGAEPVVNFQSFIDDNENIVDVVKNLHFQRNRDNSGIFSQFSEEC